MGLLLVSCKKETDNGLTSTEIDLGIKTVLRIGTDSAMNAISVVGFINDEHLKIALPNEGRIISEVVDWYSLNSKRYAQLRDLNINLKYYHQKSLLSFTL